MFCLNNPEIKAKTAKYLPRCIISKILIFIGYYDKDTENK